MSKRQLAMVMDLNKCIGCQTCTVACKTQWTNRDGREYMYWNNVETKPGKGYPQDWENMGGGFKDGNLQPGIIPSKSKGYGVPWDYNHDEIMKGETDFGTDSRPQWSVNWDEDVATGDFPNSYSFYLPRICNHCSNPACLAGCSTGAIYKREEDGVVLVDLDKCQGQQQCIAACPYKKIYFNPKKFKAEKCILCFPRIEQGLAPACADQCVGRIRFVGYLDDKNSKVHKLVHKYKVALPLHAEYGTEPNVYYVPPLPGPPTFDAKGEIIPDSTRIPVEELEFYFGPRVKEVWGILEREIEKRKKGGESELLDILIAYEQKKMFELGTPNANWLRSPALTGILALLLAFFMSFSSSVFAESFKEHIIKGHYVNSTIKTDNHEWGEAPTHKVAMNQQTTINLNLKVANKHLETAKPFDANVQVLYNEKEMGIKISWKDNTYSTVGLIEPGVFGDSVAVQFPRKYGKGISLPFIGMGDNKHLVHLHFQRATPQDKEDRKLEERFQHEFLAAGLGSLTRQTKNSTMKMLYDKEKQTWNAFVIRKFQNAHSNLKGSLIPTAFAIWNGAKYERGGNKALSKWKFIELEKRKKANSSWLKYLSYGYPTEDLGSIENGKKLVEQSCLFCHNTRESKKAMVGMAPDLSNIGARSHPQYLEESITKVDDVIVGHNNINAHYSKGGKQDKHGAYPNNEMYTWFRKDKGVKYSKMPNLSALIKGQELRDVVAYLMTLK